MRFDEKGRPILTFAEKTDRYLRWAHPEMNDPVYEILIKPFVIKKPSHPTIDPRIDQLLKERDRYRREKNWAESDRIRLEIEKMGYKVIDSVGGVKLTYSSPN